LLLLGGLLIAHRHSIAPWHFLARRQLPLRRRVIV